MKISGFIFFGAAFIAIATGLGAKDQTTSAGLASADALLRAGDDAAAAKAYEVLGLQAGAKREGWRQNNWGLALLRLDRPAAALEHFQSSIEADRANYIARANLGAAWERVGDLTKALDVYERALELIRAENFGRAGGRPEPEGDEEVRENLASAVSLSPTVSALEKVSLLGADQIKIALGRAGELLNAGRYAEAAAAYADLGRTSPMQREGWRLNNWGLCYLRLAQPSSARERLEQSVRVFPDNPVAWNNLAMAYEQLGMSDKAEDARGRGEKMSGAGTSNPQRLELVRLKLAFAAQRKRWQAMHR